MKIKNLILVFVLMFLGCLISCKEKNYKVKYIVDGKEWLVEETKKGELELKSCDKTGYDFLGWLISDSSDKEIYKHYFIKSDITFSAVFEQKKYIVNFGDDTDNSLFGTHEYHYGDDVAFPIDIDIPDGYDFMGWKIDNEKIGSYKITDLSPREINIKAIYSEHDYIADAVKKVNIPSTTNTDLVLPTDVDGVKIAWDSSEPDYLDENGKINRDEIDIPIILTATYTYKNKMRRIEYTIVVLKYESLELLELLLNNYHFDGNIRNSKIDLVTNFSTENTHVNAVWNSSNKEIIDNLGNIVDYPIKEQEIVMTLTLSIGNVKINKEYKVVVPGLSNDERFDAAIKKVNISKYVSSDICLPNEFPFNVAGTWSSSDETILTNDGIVKSVNQNYKVILKLSLELDDNYIQGGALMKEYEFEVNVNKKTSLPIVNASMFNEKNMIGTKLVNNRLELDEDKIYGEYESDIVDVLDFKSVVPSWSAISSTTATVEFMIKVKVDNVWSEYISYCKGGWGLGLKNSSVDQNVGIAKLSDDEVIINNNKTSNAIKFKLILRRNNVNVASPSLSLVAFALDTKKFTAKYTIDNLPTNVCYDVPKLYQGAVPSIGNSICSATSTTMLLKYKGLDFSDKDSLYEHRYMASIVKDYGNNIYGNWVYNVVTMGGYGFNAYVCRMYSIEELLVHLATVGPCALSVKGTMISNLKTYTTQGHLIVAIGYRIENNSVTFIVNDPNVKEVKCEYSKSVIENTWRKITYVIE